MSIVSFRTEKSTNQFSNSTQRTKILIFFYEVSKIFETRRYFGWTNKLVKYKHGHVEDPRTQFLYIRSYFKFKLILLFIIQTFRCTTYSMMYILENCLLSETGLRVYLMHCSYHIHLLGIFLNIFLNKYFIKLHMKLKSNWSPYYQLTQVRTSTDMYQL